MKTIERSEAYIDPLPGRRNDSSVAFSFVAFPNP